MFTGKRVYLRAFAPTDVPTFHRWRCDFEVMQYDQHGAVNVTDLSATQDWYDRISRDQSSFSYAIVEKETDRFIGTCALMRLDPKNHHSECAIVIGEKDAWGRGYGKEALGLLLRYGFEELNLHRIYLRVFSFNERAIRLYLRLGFVEEGRQREALYRFGQWHDVIMMGLLRREFMALEQ